MTPEGALEWIARHPECAEAGRVLADEREHLRGLAKRDVSHDLVALNGHGECRWSACRCGWLSPTVADQRTAVQAYAAHVWHPSGRAKV